MQLGVNCMMHVASRNLLRSNPGSDRQHAKFMPNAIAHSTRGKEDCRRTQMVFIGSSTLGSLIFYKAVHRSTETAVWIAR